MKKIIVVLLALIMCLSLCACGKSEAVKNVEKAIDAIGEVTLGSHTVIDNATALLDALTSEEQAKVKNIRVLTQAQEKLQSLIDQQISVADACVSRLSAEVEDSCFIIESSYLEEEKTYCVLMGIDRAGLEEFIQEKGFEGETAEQMVRVMMKSLDENTETIGLTLNLIKNQLEAEFPEDSGITVIVGYCDQNGDITHCY